MIYTSRVDPSDLSIGYEAWARPGLGLRELRKSIEAADPLVRLRMCDEQWQSFVNVWERVHSLSLLGVAKAYNIFKLAKGALSLPGDFIECGVFQGGLSLMLGLMLKEACVEKKVFMCDTFAGLPKPNRTVDKAYVEGTMACAADVVAQSVSRMGLDERCVIQQGLFRNTFCTFSEVQTFAFAHIDCDLYEGTKESIEFLYPRLAERAPVVLDDYYDESHGVMRAINEFAEQHRLTIHLGAWGQAFLLKGEQAGVMEPCKIGPNAVHLMTEAISEEPVFLAYLEAIANEQEQKARRLRQFVKFCRQITDFSNRS